MGAVRPSSSPPARGATGRPPGRRTARGSRSSPTGSRRATSFRTRCRPSGPPDADPATLAATLTGSAESVAWSSDGTRLLVLAADPGSYGLDWSARAVNGADAASRPGRSGARATRAAACSCRSRDQPTPGGRPGRSAACGSSTGTATTPSSRSCRAITPAPAGTRSVVARLDLDARTAETLYEPTWQTGSLALSPDAARVDRRRGLRERPRPARRQHRRARPRRAHDHRPVARPADGRTRLLVRRRLPLVRDAPTGPGTACGRL